MYIAIAIIILGILYYYFVVVKHGDVAFWKKVSKNPEFFYEQLKKDEAWVIDDGSINIDKNKYTGPFMLHVPSLGKVIRFYGKIGEYEDSQKRIKEEKIR